MPSKDGGCGKTVPRFPQILKNNTLKLRPILPCTQVSLYVGGFVLGVQRRVLGYSLVYDRKVECSRTDDKHLIDPF